MTRPARAPVSTLVTPSTTTPTEPGASAGIPALVLVDDYQWLSTRLDGVDLRLAAAITTGPVAAPPAMASMGAPIATGQTGPDPAGFSADDLEGAMAGLIHERTRWLAARYGVTPRPDVAAYSAMLHYLWLIGLALGGPYLLGARVPTPRRLVVSADLSCLTVDAPGVVCLPDVDAPRVDALRWHLRTGMAQAAAPVLDAFAPYLRRSDSARRSGPSHRSDPPRRPAVRRGMGALWAAATDQFVSALWSVGRALGEEERCVTETQALLPGPGWPCARRPGFRTLNLGAGRSVFTRTRYACCRYYTLTTPPPCLTCPRIDDTERLRRLA